MAHKYFYLIPSRDNKSFSVLVESNCVANNGSEGRWRIQGTNNKTYASMVIPTTSQVDISKAVWTSENFCFNVHDATGAGIKKIVGEKNGWEAPDYVSSFMDDLDVNASYLKIKNDKLILCKHTKGDWSATIGQWYFKKKNLWDSITGLLVDSAGEEYKEYTITGNTKVPSWELKGATDAGWRVTITFNVTETVLADAGEWDIGADYSGSNIRNNYCFYCTDINETKWLKYLINYPTASLSTRLHSCTKHGATPVSETTDDKYNVYSSNTSYRPKDKYTSGTIGKVDKLAYGTTGEYVDGVAAVPFVMIELKPSENSTVGYNISLPTSAGKGMESVVSLTHERNMADSYNTFVIQLFDRDAMEIEGKLLLGFRYITFYYTDFVSTSKRYKGQVLDFKTTITGKGLMLTLNGYSSNVNTYVGKDSIPWSIICAAKDKDEPAFYYWMNKAGEYHGEVYLSNDGKYNSSEGTLVDPSSPGNSIDDINSSGYYMKVKNTTSNEDGTQTTTQEWISFRDYYTEKGATEQQLNDYEPKAHKFTLSTNGYDAQLSNILADKNIRLSEMRPSDIVIIICIINGWSYKVKTTKSVTEIPDQLSMSYIEYIKEKLIPISVSDEQNASTQYYFWFDDDGVAHYEPYDADTSDVKKLYFNAPEHKDSYPLIGFTSATNGSVLMVTDASNTMEAINAFTGDELSLSTVEAPEDDPAYLSTVVEKSEWYSTNRLTASTNERLISYSNVSALPSETELKNQLLYRWGTVAKYSYKATLDVYGCADITPGNYVDIYIYLDDGQRSNDDISSESDYYKDYKKVDSQKTYNEDGTSNGILQAELDESRKYTGNLTMHHSSGRYIVNKITDTISAGKYMSSLEVFKVDKSRVLNSVKYNSSDNTESKSKETVNSTGGSGGSSW